MHRDDPPHTSVAIWRAVVVYRFATLGYAALLIVLERQHYSRLDWAWFVFALMTVWTMVTTTRYRASCGVRFLTADLVISAALLGSTFVLQYPDALRRGVTPVTAIWVAGPVLAWAARYGPVPGAAVALLLSGIDVVLRHGAVSVTLNGAVLMLLAGLLVGQLSKLSAELDSERHQAAQTQERDRLARTIHDSVLQVLALVQRRGAEAGGEAAELGRLAGQQEAALRALITGSAEVKTGAQADIRSLLRPLQNERTTVSAPATSVVMNEVTAAELTSAVCAVLDNVRRHCGEQAKAWLLIEDEPYFVTVTIRDDGPGIPDGRLAEAAAAGRLGISHSINGRIKDIGGRATIRSSPGQGTEVELRVPK